MDRFADRKGLPRSAKCSMTSRDKQKKCTRQESPSKRRSIVTSFPRNSRISRSTRGASRLGRRLPNFMRNGKEGRSNRGDKNVEKKRELFSRFFHFILPRRSFSCAL